MPDVLPYDLEPALLDPDVGYALGVVTVVMLQPLLEIKLLKLGTSCGTSETNSASTDNLYKVIIIAAVNYGFEWNHLTN